MRYMSIYTFYSSKRDMSELRCKELINGRVRVNKYTHWIDHKRNSKPDKKCFWGGMDVSVAVVPPYCCRKGNVKQNKTLVHCRSHLFRRELIGITGCCAVENLELIPWAGRQVGGQAGRNAGHAGKQQGVRAYMRACVHAV